MRPIDADALYKDICDSIDQMTNIGVAVDGEYLWAKLHDALDNAPTIDIVFCKECIHKRYDATNDMYQCKKTFHRFYTTDHYCSYGEREGE